MHVISNPMRAIVGTPLMMPKIVSKPHSTHVFEMIPARPKTKKNPRRVLVWYRPKTLRRLSQKNLSQL